VRLRFLDHWKSECRAFRWTKTAAQIKRSIHHTKLISETHTNDSTVSTSSDPSAAHFGNEVKRRWPGCSLPKIDLESVATAHNQRGMAEQWTQESQGCDQIDPASRRTSSYTSHTGIATLV
jgi:hypothetical protein